MSHSCHPNIDVTGSVTGMKNKGFWGKKDRIVRSHGFQYNIDIFDIADNTLEIVPSYKNIRSLWVSVKTTPDTKAGVYPITITIKNVPKNAFPEIPSSPRR